VINYAQGAMAMFTTYVALFTIEKRLPYWAAFVIALASGLVMKAAVERVLARPVESAPPLNVIILTLGLLLLLEAVAPMIFGDKIRSFPPAFPIVGLGAGSSRVPPSSFDLFTPGSVLRRALLLGLLSQPTRLGPGLRA